MFNGNMTHNDESAAIWNLKSEWWGTPVVQKNNYQEK
jgi:hypothetical protein